MKTLAVNSRNDLTLSGRSLSVATGLSATMSVCERCALAILGEMVFSQQDGMPYFETTWVGAPTTAPFEAAFRQRIQRVPGVLRIDDLTTAFEAGVMTYSATITTTYGTGTING